MSEFSAQRDGNEGYEARDDEEQEKAPTLFRAGASHFCPQCGQLPRSAAGAFVDGEKCG